MTIFVVGNVTEDLVFRLPRLPVPGETLIADTRLVDTGGKGLNQAIIAARCGVPTRLIAPIGSDEAGAQARRIVGQEPLWADLLGVDAPTDQSIIAVSATGENVIVSSAAAADSLTADMAIGALRDCDAKDTVMLQGNLGRKTTLAVLRYAKGVGAFAIINPSPIRWDYHTLWPFVDLAIFNRAELSQLSGEEDVASGLNQIREFGVATAIVTLGADGACAASQSGQTDVAAAATTVYDTAGAGDTFCGVLAASIARGLTPSGSLRPAAAAAAVTISRAGTHSAFPTVAELAKILGRHLEHAR